MKKALLILMAAVLALPLCACGKSKDDAAQATQRPQLTQAPIAGGDYEFSIKNDLGSSVAELYISESTSDDWGTNLLDGDSIYDGGAYEVYFAPEQSASDSKYDIAVVTGDEAEYHFEGINLNGIDVVTLTWNDDDEVVAELD